MVFDILLCAFTKMESISQEVLDHLSILSLIPEGYDQVMQAFDEYIIYAQERIRFQTLFALLKTASNVKVVENGLILINFLLDATSSISQRMAVGY